jgi:UDP:flavonoid glycosyltransferase YjiC (YdhE family)
MRLLGTCMPSLGHFHPMVALARAVRAAGHEFVFATAPSMHADVRAVGFDVLAAGVDPDPRDRARTRMTTETWPAAAVPALVAHCRAWRAELLLHEEGELAGPIAAAIVGIPAVTLGWPAPLMPADRRARLDAAIAPHWAAARRAPSQELYLDCCPPSLQAPRALPATLRMRPVAYDAVDDRVVIASRTRAQPRVYVTFGTVPVFNRLEDGAQRVLAALADAPIELVVTTGVNHDPAALAARFPRARIARYLPLGDVLPECDAVVCHGGASTTTAALAHGLPVVIVPRGADSQRRMAEACAARGAGIAITGEPSAARIAGAVSAVLDDARFRRAAREVAAEIAELPSPRELVGALVDLLPRAMPARRAAPAVPELSIACAIRRAAGLDAWLARWIAVAGAAPAHVQLIAVGRGDDVVAAAQDAWRAHRRALPGWRATFAVAEAHVPEIEMIERAAARANAARILVASADRVPTVRELRALIRGLADPRTGVVRAADAARAPWIVRTDVLHALGLSSRYAGSPFAERDLALRARALGFRAATLAAGEPEPAPSRGAASFAARWGNGEAARIATLPIARAARRPDELVVYTAIAGAYDPLRARHAATDPAVRFLAFVDEPARHGWRGWDLRALPADGLDPIRRCRRAKLLAHALLPPHRYSLWIDGSIELTCPFGVERLVALYLRGVDLCILRHRTRTCIYDEGAVCAARGLDDPARITAQLERYRAAGFPAHAGLAESTVILRRHNAAVARFERAWWDELVRGSRRDQLSFPVVARATGLRYATFPLTLDERGLFRRHAHRLQRRE